LFLNKSGRKKELARKSKLDVYVDGSVQLIPEVAAVIEAKSNVKVEKKKTQAEEPLYLDRM